jgi:integrase
MDGHRADTAFIADSQSDGGRASSKPKRITSQVVAALKPPVAGNRVVWDRDLTGFGVRITAAGAVSFVLRYVLHGRERRYTIGRHPDLSPSAARLQATALRGAIVAGKDPLEARHEAREAPTMAELCDDYMERHARPKKRQSSADDDESLIRLYVKPNLGNRKVLAVGRREVDELHQSLKDRPYQANRVLALLSKMFNLAVQWGWRTDNPVKGIGRFHEEKRDRWASTEEMAALGKALSEYPDRRIGLALVLILLTGARKSEVLKATWDQFDLTRGVWTKPSHHTKQKKTEHVPLNRTALRIVSGLKAERAKQIGEGNLKEFPFLFPGDKPGMPLYDLKGAWKKICEAAGLENIRMHDLRHTFASHLVSTGHSLPMVGKLIGHTQASTTQRYAHLADAPLRHATEQFGKIMDKASRKSKLSLKVT